MSGTKRTLSAEQYSVNIDDNDEQVTDPVDSSDSKKLRRDSSYSDNDAQTQIAEEEIGMRNGRCHERSVQLRTTLIASGYSTDQSESEPEREEDEDDDEEDIGAAQENELNVRTDYELLHVYFDTGMDDSKSFDERTARFSQIFF